jgi:predicted nucleic acid-binding protein
MRVLIDTNILVRLTDSSSPAYAAVRRESLAGADLVLVPQVLTEYWAVVTRPEESNGLGLSTERAAQEIESFKRDFDLVYDSASCHRAWETLVVKYSVKGKRTHDAKLVAAMVAHGIPSILTFNASDFRRYEEVEIIYP